MICFKCSAELQSYDSDTRRWFEPSGKNHQCERIALYTKEPGFFVKLSPFAIASNITKIAEQNHWKQDRLLTEQSKLITWDKKEGINWLGFTMNSEFVVFAYRGKYPIVVSPGKSLPTVFYARRTKHSEKPIKFYDLIRAVTSEPRIDIFARKRHYGFSAYGDQAEAEPLTIESFN